MNICAGNMCWCYVLVISRGGKSCAYMLAISVDVMCWLTVVVVGRVHMCWATIIGVDDM